VAKVKTVGFVLSARGFLTVVSLMLVFQGLEILLKVDFDRSGDLLKAAKGFSRGDS
jgi:hypothetical protein